MFPSCQQGYKPATTITTCNTCWQPALEIFQATKGLGCKFDKVPVTHLQPLFLRLHLTLAPVRIPTHFVFRAYAAWTHGCDITTPSLPSTMGVILLDKKLVLPGCTWRRFGHLQTMINMISPLNLLPPILTKQSFHRAKEEI